MAHYDLFRHHLAIKYPAYGHALWEPSPVYLYPPVEIGDVGFTREGRFHRLFNTFLPAEDPSHENYGVPEYYEQLTLRMRNHIIPGTLSPNSLCSARVSLESVSRVMAAGPDSPPELVFSCKRKPGAILSFPVQARCQNTVALGDFGEWMIKNIDSWFAWVRQLGVGIERMEDIILVTGTHRTRSWTNVAFPGGQEDAQVSFGANVATRGDAVSVDWKISHEYNRGAVLNCGPGGEDLPEDQCIFIRGFRVTRKLRILTRELKAAARPNSDPKGDDCDPDVELQSILSVPEYWDPLHILQEYIAEVSPNCDMVLVHDDDLTCISELSDDTLLEALEPDALLRHLRSLKPKVHDILLGPDSSSDGTSVNTDAETFRVATLSAIFEERHEAKREAVRVAHDIDKKVEGAKGRVQGAEENVKSIEEKAQMIIDEGNVAAMEENLIIQKTAYNVLRESLRNWQSPPDPSRNHNIASDLQYEGTARWFCRGKKFEEWKATGSLLCIFGKPGSGKSILCSAIINDIATLQKAGLASMAYFYFDFRDVDKKSRRGLLSSLLIQLAARSETFCDILYRLYKEYDDGTHQPSDSALIRSLKAMLTLPGQPQLYIILDALDECPNTSGVSSSREQVLDFVEEFVSLRLPNLRICATSRPEIDIQVTLASLASHSVYLHDESGQQEDIAKYVESVVYSFEEMRRWRDEDKDLVIKTLSEKADRMFRWVFCQLEVLRHCFPLNIPRVLSELPASLDETYERVLTEIGTANRHHAYRLLQSLAVAIRPLRVEELAEILALDFDDAKDGIPQLKEDWRWQDQQDAVLSTCSSLITVVDRVVQFSHFSVKEFLTSDRLATSSKEVSRFRILPWPSHTVFAQACLGILLQSDNYVDDVKARSSSLFEYAAQHWVDHAQFEDVSTRIEDGMQRLFDPTTPYFEEWVKLVYIDEGWKTFAGLGDERRGSPLYYSSLCGFHTLTAQLVTKHTMDVNATLGRCLSPLVAALHKRHFSVAELLIQHGAEVDITGYRNRTPLLAASMDGFIDIVEWLLDHGANAMPQQDDGETPLHLAARNGQSQIMRMLLEHDVSINAKNKLNRTPLHVASEDGQVDIVRLLLEHGAEISSQDLSHCTPLILASRSFNRSPQSFDTVRLLIEYGADVGAQDGSQKNPLHLASYQAKILEIDAIQSADNTNIVQLLLDNGENVDENGDNSRTPL